MRKSGFKPFTLSKPDGTQWCRFEPTDDPDMVFIRFQGACGQIMERAIDTAAAVKQMAHLHSLGYEELKESEDFEQKFLHDI